MKRPLIDLHLHLDGSLRLKTMIQIAKRGGADFSVKTQSELRRLLRCGKVRDSLQDYLTAFPLTVSVMQTEQALTRIASELIEDFAAEGGRYAEVRFCPLLHARNGMKPGRRWWGDILQPSDAVEAVLKGLKEAGEKHGVGWGLILCSLRHFDQKHSQEIVMLAKAYQHEGVVAVDLAGDDSYDALKHARHFQWASERGIHVTIHAAESGPAHRVSEAILYFRAERIGHGVRAIEDPRTVELMRERGVAVEACLTSNIQTRTVSAYGTHPAHEYLKQGVLVTLNTDNRLLADTTVTREFALAKLHWQLNEADERKLTWNAIEASFADPAMKAKLLAELDAS